MTCWDGATCEGETWARAPCVAGTRETVAPCEGTGEQCSVESGRAYSWFVVLPGPAAAAAAQAEVPASSAGQDRPVLDVDLDGRETFRDCSQPALASSAGPDLRVPPGADLSGSAGSSRASSAGRDPRELGVDWDDQETCRGCFQPSLASAVQGASHADQEPSQGPSASVLAPSRAFLLPSAF